MQCRICGLKVDRAAALKVQCVICNTLGHAWCNKIKPEELEFVKLNFKCKKCLSTRRGSLSGSPVVVGDRVVGFESEKGTIPDDIVPMLMSKALPKRVSSKSPNVVENAVVVGSNKLADNPVPTIKRVAMPKSAAIKSSTAAESAVVVNITEVANLPIVADKVRCESAVSSNISNSEVGTSEQSINSALSDMSGKHERALNLILRKLCSLERRNESLCDAVSTLKEDNKTLQIKVAELEQVIIKLASSCSLKTNIESLTNTSGVVVAANKKSKTAARGAINKNVVSDAVAGVRNNVARVDVADVAVNVPNIVLDRWSRTQGRRKKANNVVIGTSISNELGVYDKLKWLHISSFKNTVSEDDIIKYISKATNCLAANFACHKLLKKVYRHGFDGS